MTHIPDWIERTHTRSAVCETCDGSGEMDCDCQCEDCTDYCRKDGTKKCRDCNGTGIIKWIE